VGSNKHRYKLQGEVAPLLKLLLVVDKQRDLDLKLEMEDFALIYTSCGVLRSGNTGTSGSYRSINQSV
jgi:hypothetical protein